MIESILKDIGELKKRTTRPLVTAGINMVLEIIKSIAKIMGGFHVVSSCRKKMDFI